MNVLPCCRVMSSDLLSGINSALGDGTERLLAVSHDNRRHGDTNSIRSYGTTDSIGSFSGASGEHDPEQNGKHNKL